MALSEQAVQSLLKTWKKMKRLATKLLRPSQLKRRSELKLRLWKLGGGVTRS